MSRCIFAVVCVVDISIVAFDIEDHCSRNGINGISYADELPSKIAAAIAEHYVNTYTYMDRKDNVG